MNEQPEQELDWTHLPADCDVQSLWVALHDGEIISCKSNLIDRTVTFECSIEHLLDEGSDVKFILQLDKVASARATVWIRWPGEFKVPEGVSCEEQGRLIEDYHKKWREESIGWHEFEASFVTDQLRITDAELARRNEQIALKIGGVFEGEKFDELYCTIVLIGSGIRASRSDNQTFDFESLLDLGRWYWDSFGEDKTDEAE